ASLCGSNSTHPYRVMIIEDAIEQVQFYTSLLKAYDFEVTVCTEPLEINRYLAKYDPELILMDLYMPDVNGYELAQTLRQQNALFSLPIVFLSSEHDPQLQLQALQSGGDDFLSKPVHPRQLCLTLAGHIERYRKMCRHSEIDSMTGLLKRDKFQQRLESELLRAYRYTQSISLLLIDTDHFREINRIYGFSVGDQIIKTLANLLQQRLRSTDIIARYSGEKFAVILPETDKQSAEQLSNHLRDSFAATPFQGQQQSFFTSFSVGVSDNHANHSYQQLLESAEEALNKAKQSGRNRVAMQ
ncbi:MAG: diguanylate cyclase, partial [Gammaproteobacteria bacterium]|nr:diguanylate cyclase [Gammaproteobacteria bacterium]